MHLAFLFIKWGVVFLNITDLMIYDPGGSSQYLSLQLSQNLNP